VNLLAALAGGFVGTLVISTLLQLATELRLTRVDIPFLLGGTYAISAYTGITRPTKEST